MSLITNGQIRSLSTALRPIVKKDAQAICFIVEKLLDRKKPLSSLQYITHNEWVRLRDMLFPDWYDDDWTVGVELRRRAANFHEMYLEGVLNQMRMFKEDEYG